MEFLRYPCCADHSLQSAYAYRADDFAGARPLAVALHTWSYGAQDGDKEEYFAEAERRNWHLIFPHFRGPNWLPEACGSDLAVSDVADAAGFMKTICCVDPERVYLIGGSGGGHAALLLAGRHPELWSAVSAWCPISDIAAWYAQCSGTRFQTYADNVRAACGGDPLLDPQAVEEARRRSPLTALAAAAGVKVMISTGIHDGHEGSVPVSQAIRAFNLLAAEPDRIPESAIDFICRSEAVPETLRWAGNDPGFGSWRVLLRRQSRNAELNLFEGAHNILVQTGMEWLSRQRRNAPGDWSLLPPLDGNGGKLSK